MSGSTLVNAFCVLAAAGPVKTSLSKTEGDGKVRLSTVHSGRDGAKVAKMLETALTDADKAFDTLTKRENFRANISIVDDAGLVTKVSKACVNWPKGGDKPKAE